jgi:hypothetical protein
VRCYSSTDLYNWTDLGLIIPPVLDDESSPLHPAMFMDRPHIVRHPESGQLVCWVKVMSDKGQRSTVLVADDIRGPYSIVRADLTPDYTDATGYYSTHFPRLQPPYVREAPAYFERGGQHFLITSGTTGYYPNSSEVATAPSYHGPWTVLNDPHPTDTSRTSFRSQVTSVFRHPHKEDLYIALADRWLPRYEETSEAAVRMHADRFRPMGGNVDGDWQELTEIDTSIADYVWLPLRFTDDGVFVDWHDEWRIEDYA